MSAQPRFDPYAILTALERQRTTYILIGAFARVIQGTDEITRGLDLVPSLRPENLTRLGVALEELDASRDDGKPIAFDEATIRALPVIELRTAAGELKIVPEPAGTRGGYDDLRRAASRESLGRGLRPSVASTADLARMVSAFRREQDLPALRQLRYLRELDLGREIKRYPPQTPPLRPVVER